MSGRVTAANYCDVLLVKEARFHPGAGIEDSLAGKSICAVCLQASPAHPQSQEQNLTVDFRTAVQLQRMPGTNRLRVLWTTGLGTGRTH